MGCKRTSHANHNALEDNLDVLPILSPVKDGCFASINDFKFVNQHNNSISQEDVDGKVYVAEFFFSSCPSICPLVSKQLKRVYNTYKDESNFMILSHTIDPKNDTVSTLLDYYNERLLIEQPSNWHLLTGDKEEIYELANFSYGAVVYEEGTKSKDNIMHSGALLLIDKKGLIRGMYDGKDKEAVDRLIVDIEHLFVEDN